MKRFALLVAVACLALSPALAEASVVTETVTVSGKSTVYFAGRTNAELQSVVSGSIYGPGDYFGDLSDPATVPDEIDITTFGDRISISATGLWSHTPTPDSGPEGKAATQLTNAPYGIFGVNLLNTNLNALVGVFLSDVAPTAGSAPTLGTNSAPGLNQAFVIGAGLDEIFVPNDATRLYLGLHNGYEWTNNSGSVTATITAIPEPASLIVWSLLGLTGLGVTRWRKRNGMPSGSTSTKTRWSDENRDAITSLIRNRTDH